MMTEAQTTSENRSFFQTWGPLIVLALAMAVPVVNLTTMSVSISAIVRDLDTDVGHVQAAITLLSLVMAALMLTGGKSGDIYGKKRMFVGSVMVFGLGLLIAALSPTVEVLIVGWAIVGGLGGAVLTTVPLALLLRVYEGQQRARAFGVLAAVLSISAAIGPLAGGFLTTYLSWRWAFGLLAAIMVLVLLLTRWLEETERDPDASIDWVGTLLSALGLVAVILAVVLAGYYGWWKARRAFVIGPAKLAPWGLSIAPLLLVGGVLILVFFVLWQEWRRRKDQEPLIRVGLLRNRQLLAGVLAEAGMSLAAAGVVFVIPVFLQSVLEYDALQTGLVLLAYSSAGFVAALGTANLGQRIAPKYLILGGLSLMGVGAGLLYVVVGPDLTGLHFVPGLLVMGAGQGLVLAQIANVTLSAVDPAESGGASGVRSTIRELGVATGTALIGAILMLSLFAGIVDGMLNTAGIVVGDQERQAIVVALEDAVEAMTTPEEEAAFIAQLPPAVQESLDDIVETATVQAMRDALLVVLFIVLVCLVPAVFLSGERLGAP